MKPTQQPLAKLAANIPYAIVGGPFGSKLTSADYVDVGIPVIRGTNLNGGRYLTKDGFVFVSEQKVREDLFGNLAHKGDLVFTQRGTLGQVSLIPPDAPFDTYVVSQSQMKMTVDPIKVDARFIYYWFTSRETIESIASRNSSSGVPHINLSVLRNFHVPVPDRQTQARIADLLSAYDDLIENNNARIALLEDSARLLYREWFVYLRFPGHEHVDVVDGLPEGWERRTLGDCATFQSGGTPSKARTEFWQGDVPWISSGELTSMRVSSSTQLVTDEAVRVGSRYASPGTILAVVRGMSLAKEFRLGVVSKRVCFNQDLKAFVPDRGVESLYLFHALDQQRERIRQTAGEASHGTKKLETAVLEEVSIPVALAALRRHFVDYVSPLHRQLDLLTEQNRKLTQARDILLPRLMNGEIAV